LDAPEMRIFGRKMKLFSKISSLVSWLYVHIVYHYPSGVHGNYKLVDAVSAPDKRRLQSFAIEYDANFTTTQKEITIVIIRLMFVKEGRNKRVYMKV
jgi:hypothetical protein